MAIRIKNKCTEIVAVIDLPHAWCAIISAAGSQSRLMERAHLRTTLCSKRDVHAALLLDAGAKPEFGLPSLAKASPPCDLKNKADAQRLERLGIESLASLKVATAMPM